MKSCKAQAQARTMPLKVRPLLGPCLENERKKKKLMPFWVHTPHAAVLTTSCTTSGRKYCSLQLRHRTSFPCLPLPCLSLPCLPLPCLPLLCLFYATYWTTSLPHDTARRIDATTCTRACISKRPKSPNILNFADIIPWKVHFARI